MASSEKRSENSVFVTVCDQRDIDSAKQLFAAAATKGRWKGDYCLICRDLEDSGIRWFRERAVVVKPACPIVPEEIWDTHKRGKTFQVSMLKFHMFSEAFREWDSVVYMDTDILIRGSIGELSEVDAFSASWDSRLKVGDQFRKPIEESPIMCRKKLKTNAFNAGVFAFSSASIPENAFEELTDIAMRTLEEAENSDQSFLNLYFAGKWNRLPAEFNAMPGIYGKYGSNRDEKILNEARVVHYAGRLKPSESGNPGHREWAENLRTAETASSFRALESSEPSGPLSASRSVERVQCRIRLLRPVLFRLFKLRKFARNPAKVIRRRLAAIET